MTEQQETAQDDSLTEEEVAAGIAALLAGAVRLATGVTLMAAIMKLLARLPSVPTTRVRRVIARLALEDELELHHAEGVIGATYLENLLLRGTYLVNATKRVASADHPLEALKGERDYFAMHREAERRRIEAARMVSAAVELHGPLLGWRHGHPKEPRPDHLAADGRNFDARTIPISTGALPGVLPGCTCTITAPFEGAPTIR